MIEELAREIVKRFPRNHKETDPFRVLISTVLSQRTRDENTEKASKKLFEVYRTPQELAKAKPEDLYNLIKESGMYRQKAARIVEISRILVERYGGRVPDSLEELLKLPGVGRKTANIVLWVGFRKPALAVDTHVHRISNRLGWVKTRTPEETEEALKKLLPEDLWGPINGSMVEFGRRICKPQNPLCEECFLKNHCEFYRRRGKGEVRNRTER
ncbi:MULTISPECIES: endonuclease III [Thermotoga]|uniref:Endonuclease III n=2 Tax=Thermotoga petrophila TaxID=93929 RepID=A5IK50_THEP1|nr:MULTISPECIES: endonuclease III [Thermotoga]ABQ46573.1 endonuclease III [Thermotoga petrophila RKU-1]ACB08920.1 endonuclease III [Thermotoga sp. RQ2]ADA66265.1 endonuclease III [Thermotoga petrophila RKU-10]AIY87904.1 endonuclease III [Thermotoga sp. Cell2]KHC91780.1 endonuclease III [Thermotoga sp. TBGT1765]